METSQLICSTNQLTGFYMIGTLVVKGLSVIICVSFYVLKPFGTQKEKAF